MKRWAVGLMIVGLMVCAGAWAQERLVVGTRGEAVRQVQARLVALNYLEGAADGIFGEKTRAALEAFQSASGLTASGEADEATLDRLNAADAVAAPVTLGKGDSGEEVRALQQNLIRYGFLEGEADGKFGSATQAAVKAVQSLLTEQNAEAGPSGKASPALRALLAEQSLGAYLETLSLGDAGEAVARLQRRLIALNYMDGTADGNFGDYTRDALKALQTACGLPGSGEADPETNVRLFSPDAPASAHPLPRDLARGDRGKSVRAVQEKLIEMGFLAGLPDDSYGSSMAEALNRLREYLGEAGAWLETGEALSAAAQERILDEPIALYREDLRHGASGAQVSRLQRRLHSLYYLSGYQIDGRFGDSTQAAVERFQELCGLAVTGVADEATQALLYSESAAHDQTPYLIKVSIEDQKVYAFQLETDGQYEQVREMVCSTGLGDSTPRGIYRKTGPQETWHYFSKFFCWARYTYIIDGDIMFHSVLYSSRSESSLRQSSVYNLGSKASHGCVRLAVEDAKWIYENCEKRTIVIVE